MLLVHSSPIANRSFTFTFPKQMIGALVVEYDVVTSTGNTMTRDDAGNIRINWNGDDIINVPASMLNQANNLYGGFAETLFQAAAQNRMFVSIPIGLWWDSTNVWDIGDNDKVYIKCDFGALTDKSVSGNVRVHVKPQLGVMRYLHKISSYNVVSQGSGVIVNNIPISNIAEIYLDNPTGSNVTNVQISKNNDIIVDNDIPIIKAWNSYIHQLETATDFIGIELDESKDDRALLGSQIKFKYTFTAAGTLKQYFSYIEYTNQKQIESEIKSRNKIITNINQNLAR